MLRVRDYTDFRQCHWRYNLHPKSAVLLQKHILPYCGLHHRRLGRAHHSELIRSLPEERRPVVIMAGTKGENAQSTIIDGSDFCLHCLIADHWLPDSSVRTSCIGVQTRVRDGVVEIVRTTDRASSMAAYLASEQFRGFVLGILLCHAHFLSVIFASANRCVNCAGRGL